jgi:hypothetical protein
VVLQVPQGAAHDCGQAVIDPEELVNVEVVNHCFFKKRFKASDRGKKISIIACLINRKREPCPDSEMYVTIVP